MPTDPYFNAIEQAKAALADLDRQHGEVLRRMEALRQFIESGLALNRGISATVEPRKTQRPKTRAKKQTKQAPVVADQVADILRKKGKPMRVSEIVAELAKVRELGDQKQPENMVAISIKRRIKSGGEFKQLGPGIFTLGDGPGSLQNRPHKS